MGEKRSKVGGGGGLTWSHTHASFQSALLGSSCQDGSIHTRSHLSDNNYWYYVLGGFFFVPFFLYNISDRRPGH